MKRICPNPIPWNDAFKRLSDFAKAHPCTPELPPTPLILAGWAYSNDVGKLRRWEETVAWAENNGCAELISDIPDQDLYFVENPTSYAIGPAGGPMYRAWDFEPKSRPLPEQLSMYTDTLRSQWADIVGQELARVTRPIAFTGAKARRLLVQADSAAAPPWGGWSFLSAQESERRTFTRFRAAVNEAIDPHEVDHIDFIAYR
ncbi:MAG: DUF721 domain-containing protein [Chloroflexi bacterium]|nr:DUF721 domain-containing protein [Chloroflexota bacterium]